jgi:4-hydroxymandelate oxidase
VSKSDPGTSAQPGLVEPAGRSVAGLADFELAARRVTSAEIHDFVCGGAEAELTLAHNRSALDAVQLVPRLFVGVSNVSTAAAPLGTASTLPMAIAPMAYQRLLHPDGELATARAAAQAGVPFTIAMLASQTIEEIAKTGAATWFQLYWLRDRGLTRELVQRAEAAGCQALMITADTPRMGRRLRDMRNGFRLRPGVVAANLTDGPRSRAHVGRPGSSAVAEHTDAVFDPTLSWHDLDWIRELTALPLAVKGVLDPRDAARCADMGIDAVVVSNHGGRQLDGAVASLRALPEVYAAVDGRLEVFFDSGLRSGSDVLKALALGADAVLLGRPALWGLAAGGRQGVEAVLSTLREELTVALALAGCADQAAARSLRKDTDPGRWDGHRARPS